VRDLFAGAMTEEAGAGRRRGEGRLNLRPELRRFGDHLGGGAGAVRGSGCGGRLIRARQGDNGG